MVYASVFILPCLRSKEKCVKFSYTIDYSTPYIAGMSKAPNGHNREIYILGELHLATTDGEPLLSLTVRMVHDSLLNRKPLSNLTVYDCRRII